MRKFKVIYQTKKDKRQYVTTAENLSALFRKYYQKVGTYEIPIAVYEQTSSRKWIKRELSWK
jgi:hypothetical protein